MCESRIVTIGFVTKNKHQGISSLGSCLSFMRPSVLATYDTETKTRSCRTLETRVHALT